MYITIEGNVLLAAPAAPASPVVTPPRSSGHADNHQQAGVLVATPPAVMV